MLPWKIAVTPNIFKTVTATPMESAEVEYETSPALSIDGMTLDLGWPWTILDLSHRTFTSNIVNAMSDIMLDTIEVIKKTIDGLRLYYYLWHWLTLNCAGSRSWKLLVKYFKTGDKYNDGVNGSRIGNNPTDIDWQHELWPWVTLNRPRSEPQDFLMKCLE